ncbi:WhiB family transcriptional regulator [Rhodococcus sp. B10]|uniref:WhiB family transcriptional regulator n=1 Tax=Rhodococcus sp. B10 TaxID=2695876 RepID=UPI00142F589F|nr:WhiB family transcriptional regulator [Rhodococcus sp. B10]NIL77668.1 Transcriptional regulator WhiB [Rhodococcus sp. B10]
MENALCREHDPEIFFPQGTAGRERVRQVRVMEAQKVCAACPLANHRECAALALNGGAEDGVWAGVDFGDTPASRLAAKERLSLIAGRGPYTPAPRIPRVCQGPCGRPLRRQRVRIEDAPGTVALAGDGRCSSCLRLFRGQDARPELLAAAS